MMQSILPGVLMILLFTAWQPLEAESTISSTATAARESVTKAVLLEPQGFIQRIHDPVIAHENDTYYVFSTGSLIPFICSKDKVVWEFCGRVFESNPAWTRDVNPNLVDIWVPDITFFNNQWRLYYAVSSFGSQDSAIGLATNVTLDPDSPDYKWVDQGEVLRSHPGDSWNAIEYCRLHNITLQAWSPLAQGRLTGKPPRPNDGEHIQKTAALVKQMVAEKGVRPEAILIAWILRHPARIQPLPGTTNPQRLLAACEADHISLTREEWYGLFLAGRGEALP